MKDAVKVIGRITARADRIDETASLLRQLASESRKETGCTFYEVLQDKADASVFILVEEWSSAAALDAHNTTPHVQDAFAKAPGLVAKAPEIGRYSVIG